jgi:GTP-binding protein
MTPLDRQVLNLCLREGFACHILLTKADKLGRGAAGAALNFVRKEVAHMPLVSVQLFSSTTRLGLDEARQRLTVWLEGHTDAVVSDQ